MEKEMQSTLDIADRLIDDALEAGGEIDRNAIATELVAQSRHRLPGSSGPVRCYRLASRILGGGDV